MEKTEDKRTRLETRNEKIRADFLKEWERGYRSEKIFADLAKKYFLHTYTIEVIVRKRGTYKDF